MLMREGEVVADEVVEEEGDLIDIRWDIFHPFFLELLEVIGELLDDGVPVLSFSRPPFTLLAEVQCDDLAILRKELILLLLILFERFGCGLYLLLTGFLSDEIGDDGFVFLLLYVAV